jgi:branched-chain amino acid transport system permease protein
MAIPFARRSPWRSVAVLAAWLVAGVVLISLPYAGLTPYWSRQLLLITLLALVASGLNLSYGYAGELALGQAAMYAAGAYTAGYVAKSVHNDFLLTVVAAVVAALVVGLISGIPGLRMGGWRLAMVSLFLVLLVPEVVQLFPLETLGGRSGLTGIPLPMEFGTMLTQQDYLAISLALALAWFAVFRNVVRSRVGAALLVLKQSPALAGSLGIATFRLKLVAYALGAVPAGIAGAVFASMDGFVAPDSFNLDLAIAVLAVTIIGGATSVYGVLLGAAILQLGPMRADAFQQYALVAYGALLVFGGVFLTGGLSGLIGAAVRRFRRERETEALDPDAAAVELPVFDGEMLSVENATKGFGGVQVLRGVTMRAEPGRVTAVIGPNGSGKTTLLNVVSGFYRLDDGVIRIGEATVSGLPPHRVSRAGVARTFQTPAIPDGLSVEEVVTTGAYRLGGAWMVETALRLPRHHRVVRRDREAADGLLRALGLGGREQHTASSLAVGTRRMVEFARALVGRPAVVLLDEVASGLDTHEVHELGEMLRATAARGATVVLVEHNFTLVRAVADHVVVLAEGRVIASGTPAEIESHPEVIAKYLGDGADISGTSVRPAKEVTA